MDEHEELLRYIAVIGQALFESWDEQTNQQEDEDIDATMFITAIPYAANVFLKGMGAVNKNNDHLEITYMLNRLVHQHEKEQAVAEAVKGAA